MVSKAARSRRLVDTNVIVRHLTQDHPTHSATADRLFAACDRGELRLIVLPTVLAECVYVLESFYRYSPQRIADVLAVLISSPAIEIDALASQLDALKRYADTNLHYIDCVLATTAIAGGLPVG
jgi:predicted nucleic acid-binding protein